VKFTTLTTVPYMLPLLTKPPDMRDKFAYKLNSSLSVTIKCNEILKDYNKLMYDDKNQFHV